MAAPDLRPPSAAGRRASSGWSRAARRSRQAARAPATPAYADLQHGSRPSTATPSTSASTRRCPGWGSRPTSWPGRRRRCRAASRRAPRWPGWSSPTRTCSCSTSRPTTWTSARSSGWRSTSGGGGSLLVASHDRAFLDATVTRVWELRDRRLTAFRGDYSAYHRQREERDARPRKDAETQAEIEIAKEQELVQRYRSHRKYGKMHEHEARLERLERSERAARRAARSACRPRPAGAGRRGRARSSSWPDDLVVGYPGRAPTSAAATVAPFLAARAASGSGSSARTAPARPRCCGRSPASCRRSTARSPSGRTSSSATWPSCARSPLPGATVLDALLEVIPVTPGEARGYLARFLFRGDDVFKEVRALSGGERSRLELALLGIMPANLLLLDEPTNHLDIPAREAIEAFLAETPGHAPRRLPRPAPARDDLRAAVGRRRRAGRRRSTAATGPGGRRSRTAGRSTRPWRARRRGSTAGREAGRARGARSRGARPRGDGRAPGRGPAAPTAAAPAGRRRRRPAARQPKLSKDAYRRQKALSTPT